MGIPATLSSVPAQTPYIQYVATAGQTVYPYPFEITQDSDLIVVYNGTTLSTDQGYTLSGQGNSTGGNVTFTTGATSGDIVTLYRDIAIERLTQIGQNSGFSSSAFNAEFNNIYLILQQLQQSGSFALQIPNTNNPAPSTTLIPALYAGKYLAFDTYGNPTPALLTSTTLSQAVFDGFLQTSQKGATANIGAFGGGPGIVDNTTAINNAITAMSALGGGTITFPVTSAGSVYNHSGTIVPANNVTLSGYGATLAYSGNGIQYGYSSSGSTNYAWIKGFTLQPGANCTTCINVLSGYGGGGRDITVSSNSSTLNTLVLGCNTSGTTNPQGNLATAFMQWNIASPGLTGNFITLRGQYNSGSPEVVTLNTFEHVWAEACNSAGIIFGSWCDSNTFNGTTYIQVYSGSTAATAYGVVFNSDSPNANQGVYNEYIEHLAVDYYGVKANVVAVQLEECANITIDQFFGPSLSGGRDLQVSSGCYSYRINHVNYTPATPITAGNFVVGSGYVIVSAGTTSFTAIGAANNNVGTVFTATGVGSGTGTASLVANNIGSNNIIKRELGVNYAIGGAVNQAFGYYSAQQGVMVGTTQGSMYLSDTLSGATLNQGLVVANSIAASTASAAYYGHVVGNVSLGSGASVTNNYGIFIYDQTSGSTGNYGIYSQVSSGSGKYAFYGAGTAPVFTAGTLGINGAAPPAQPTGYGTPTGGALTSSFAAGSITLANLAAEVAQLVLDLKKYGILGA